MVTVLVQRQQREAALRRERLLAARQAAASLSVQQARSYQTQKRRQAEDVRADAQLMWMRAQTHEVDVLDGLVRRGLAQQNDGQESAAQHHADLQLAACEEAAAWQAEHQLEAARHRLAVAYTKAEEHDRARPHIVAQRRREAVKAMEAKRAARVAAAPSSALPLAAVMRTLQASPQATTAPTAHLPVPHPLDAGGDQVEGMGRSSSAFASATSPLPRRWRMSDVAPHTKVTLHVSANPSGAHRGPEADRDSREVRDLTLPDRDKEGQEEACEERRTTQSYAETCAAAQAQQERVCAEGQQKATQRAASALRRQHDARVQAEAAQLSQRERLAAVREVYRTARKEEEETEEEAAAAPAATEATSDALAASPIPRAPLHGLTRHQQAQKVYRESEAEFRATFVNALPVAVETAASTTPRTAALAELLRPAQVADLLYSLAHNSAPAQEEKVNAPSLSQGEVAGADGRSGRRPSAAQSRVLPSAPLRMQLLYHPAEASATPPPDPTPDNVDQPVSGAVLHVGHATSETPARSGQHVENDDAKARRDTAAPQVFARSVQPVASNAPPLPPSPPRSPTPAPSTPPSTPLRDASREDGVQAEEIALSPLTPAAATRTTQGRAPASPPQQSLQTSPPRGAVCGSMRSSTQVSAATTPLRTPAQHRSRRDETASSSPSSSTSSPPPSTASRKSATAGEGASASTSMNSSGFTTSTASSLSRAPLPTMTAEQLKLALMRLRSRIKTAQM